MLPKILVVDDEEDILELLRYNLAKEGYTIECVGSGEEALQKAETGWPDLIILDLMLPGVNGLEVCKRLKKNNATANMPIIMLTAKGEDADIVAGLELGADDYVTKPFSLRVLVARVRAVLRRQAEAASQENKGMVSIHDLSINPARFEVLVAGDAVELTATEFNLLHFLASRPGWVFTRNQIIDGIKGSDYPVTERSVDVQIVGLRRKLGAAGQYIETVRGIGYRFKE